MLVGLSMLQRKLHDDCNKSKKKKALGTDLRVIQQINFTENLECTGRTKMLFIFEEVRKTIPGFWKRVVKVL